MKTLTWFCAITWFGFALAVVFGYELDRVQMFIASVTTGMFLIDIALE